MATRFYLPYKTSSDAAITPSLSGFITDNFGIATRCVKVKSSTAITDVSDIYDDGTNDNGIGTYLYRSFVSDQIGVFNFTGTTASAVLKCVCGGGQTVNMRLGIRLYHVGGTYTTLLATSDFGSAVGTTAATRIISAASLASVSSSNNDRLVIQVGIDYLAASSTPHNIKETFGDNNASDYALTSGLTTSLNPWVEFSGNIPDPASGGGTYNLVGGTGAFSLTGASATFLRALLAIGQGGSFVLNGNAVLVYTQGSARVLAGGTGVFVLTGNDAELFKSILEVPNLKSKIRTSIWPKATDRSRGRKTERLLTNAFDTHKALIDATNNRLDNVAAITSTKTVYLTASSGTYTPPTGIKALDVKCVGGGGGGGGAKAAASTCSASGGAGGGEVQEKYIASPAASYSYTVGARGDGGLANSPPTDGSDGQDTTFGGIITAKGGKGGKMDNSAGSTAGFTVDGGAGGTGGSGGDTASSGGDGGTGWRNGTNKGRGGEGGECPGFSTRKVPSLSGTDYDGTDRSSYGGGGTGALSVDSTSHRGGHGYQGVIVITEIY